LTYYSSIQPGPRTGRTDAADSPINDRYISLLAKLAFVFHLHLLRCTTRSFELARGHTCTRVGSNKPVDAACDPPSPPAGIPPTRTSNDTSKRRTSPGSRDPVGPSALQNRRRHAV